MKRVSKIRSFLLALIELSPIMMTFIISSPATFFTLSFAYNFLIMKSSLAISLFHGILGFFLGVITIVTAFYDSTDDLKKLWARIK